MQITSRTLKNWLYLLPAICLIVFITIYPLLYSIVLSFHRYNPQVSDRWQFIGLGNYLEVLTDIDFWRAIGTTFKIALPALALEFLFGLSLALLLTRKNVIFRRSLTIILVLPVMLSPTVIGLTWRMLYHEKYGVINLGLQSLGIIKEPLVWLGEPKLAILSVILTDVWQWTPLFALVLLSGLQAIPLEVYEAAQIDGASRWQSFRYITLPWLSAPILIISLIRFIDLFKLFDTVFVLTGGGPANVTETATFYIYRNAFLEFRLGYASALSYVLLIMLSGFAVLFLHLCRRRFREVLGQA